MSLPSFTKDKTSNKVSLVTRPSVTVVQPVQLVGSSKQPTLIYVQSIKPPAPPTTITTSTHKPKSSSQPVPISIGKTIIKNKAFVSNKPIASAKTSFRPNVQKLIPIPSTSSNSNQLHAFQVRASNPVLTSNSQKQQTFVTTTTTAAGSRTVLDDKTLYTKITKVTVPNSDITSAIATIPKSTTVTSNHKSGTVLNVTENDPIKFRYQTILEDLLKLKNNFIRRTITQAIKQKLCNQSTEDLLNVIFKSFELTLLSVNVEQIQLNVSLKYFIHLLSIRHEMMH